MDSTANQQQHAAAAALLSRAHSPTTAQTIFKDKIKQRPLLLRPSSPDPQSDARAKRRTARQIKESRIKVCNKPKPLSAKQKRALCIYEVPEAQRKYAIYVPLHDMWCAYMRDILGLQASDADQQNGSAHHKAYVTPVAAGPALISADYHGALVEVVRSRCSSRVGLKGIVIKDTKFTFDIITERNELKTVPKEHSVFRFEIPVANEESDAQDVSRPLIFEIQGSQFEHRAPDRANKKLKQHYNPDL